MKMKKQLIVCFLLIVFVYSQQPSQQPIIGIYTQDAEPFFNLQANTESTTTYISASYVKNMQMAGAQVIPIFYHYSEAQLQDILSKINGVFFPGGGAMSIAHDTNWVSKAAFIINYAKNQNRLGNNYPIWGTCLGYYLVMYVLSGQTDVTKMLTAVTGEQGILHPLIIKNSDSKLLRTFSQGELIDATTGDGIFYLYHHWSIMLSTFQNYPNWVNFWNVIATSKTDYGAQFMSILQGKQYPFFVTQFHAEKNAFEWQIDVKRTYNAISAQQKLANYFVNQARKNKNQFSNNQANKKLIYNYVPITIPPGGYFTQVYVFDQSNLKNQSAQKNIKMTKINNKQKLIVGN